MKTQKSSIELISLLAKENPKAVSIVIICLLLSSILEAFGISMVFPLITIILETNGELPASKLTDFIAYFASWGPYFLCLFVVFSFVLKSIVMHIAYSIIAYNVAEFSHNLRVGFVNAVLNARLTYIQSKSLGKNLSILTNDSIYAAAAYISAARALSGLFQVILYVAYAIWLSATAAALSFITVLILAVVVKGTMSKTRNAGNRTTELIHNISKNMGETLRGIKAAKATAKEEYLGQQILSESAMLRQTHKINIIMGQVLRNIQDPVLVASALFCLILFKDFLGLEPGYIMFIMAVYYRLMTSANMLQGDYQKFLGLEASLWSIKNNTNEAQEQKEQTRDGGINPPDTPQPISFNSVDVAYEDKTIFSDLSIEIPANTLCLFKGESGRGKTTAIDIICSLIKPTNGEVLIGDVSLDKIDTQKWRQTLGYVDQFPFLSKGSVRENIVLDADGITDEQLYECLKICHLEDFINRVEGGLDFELTEGGENISGGQRQRIAIARAIIRNPQYLILDEPTSALDQDSEDVIFKTLKALSKKMTIIIVSHSPDIKKYADIVIDFDEI